MENISLDLFVASKICRYGTFISNVFIGNKFSSYILKSPSPVAVQRYNFTRVKIQFAADLFFCCFLSGVSINKSIVSEPFFQDIVFFNKIVYRGESFEIV